jgi:hypothetical protein
MIVDVLETVVCALADFENGKANNMNNRPKESTDLVRGKFAFEIAFPNLGRALMSDFKLMFVIFIN